MKNMKSLQTPGHFVKSTFFLAIFLGLGIFLFAQDKTPYHIEKLNGKNIQGAELTTSGGSIQVISEAGENYRLEVYIKGNNGKELSDKEIEQRLNDKYHFTIEMSNNMIKAHAKTKAGFTDWKNSLNISYKLYVPAKINSNLKTSGGSITLKGLDGSHNFSTSGGSLTVKDVSGQMQGKTSGGSINVSGSEGDIDLKTSGGSISASDCKGQIQLSTSGGSLKLDNLKGTIQAKTSGGSVSGTNVDGELVTSTSGGSVRIAQVKGSIDASTSGGSMDISVVELGKYVKLRNSAGSIHLKIPSGKGADLELKGMGVSVPNLTNFSGNSEKNSLDGTIHGGGTSVSAKSSAGKVTLTFN
jgi:DUF4097 and DUF4098 domain-containing protein YvlB